ncbi:hypothetical protein ALO_00805 [Acetonema longum DSM 6540]|uniref:Uncharacterized protein n=1 Tax=Acetonema longum DSM 6540 TaxID=1009370 RepID=F7NDQ4_9FIRM|nr:hypothetical protein ALO_00805 [Acetonema longum DSM 6540]
MGMGIGILVFYIIAICISAIETRKEGTAGKN